MLLQFFTVGVLFLMGVSANGLLISHSTFPSIDRSNPHAGPTHYYIFNAGAPKENFAQLSKRGVGGQYFCEGANWTGICGYSCCMKNFCLNYEPASFNKISSVGPDLDTVCWFFEDVVNFPHEECYGNQIEVRWPGIANLSTVNFDNRIKSWTCWKDQHVPADNPMKA